MDRRNFVNTSLLVAGTVLTSPSSLVGDSNNELDKFRQFSSKPWDLEGAKKYLESLGSQQISVLRKAIRGDDSASCSLAMCLVMRMDDALALLPELIVLAGDDQHPDWHRAVTAIGNIGLPARTTGATAALESQLDHPNPLNQLDVVNSLVQIDPSRLDEFELFLRTALDPSFGVVFQGCWVVGEFVEQGCRFVPQLEEIVFDPVNCPDAIRCEAARAIYKITDDSNLPAVQLGVQIENRLLNSLDHRIRSITSSRIQRCGAVVPIKTPAQPS
jgi:hypothetical protein